jgi:hypothetical protein
LGELEAEDQRFHKEVWVAGEALRARRRVPIFWWAAGPAVAAAAAVLVFVTTPGSSGPPDPNLTKGGDGLALIVRHADGRTEDVLPGQSLSPGDAVRMVVTARAPDSALVILDFDGRGKVSAFEPAHGDPKRIGAGRQLVEGSVVLDDALGPERLLALFCGGEISTSDAIAAGQRALTQVGGDPRAVHTLGLPCREASLLIQKEPSR